MGGRPFRVRSPDALAFAGPGFNGFGRRFSASSQPKRTAAYPGAALPVAGVPGGDPGCRPGTPDAPAYKRGPLRRERLRPKARGDSGVRRGAAWPVSIALWNGTSRALRARRRLRAQLHPRFAGRRPACRQGTFRPRDSGPIRARIQEANTRAGRSRRSQDGPDCGMDTADCVPRRTSMRPTRTLGRLNSVGRRAAKAVRARPAGTRPMRRHPAPGRSLPDGRAVPGHGLPAGAGAQLDVVQARRLSIRLPNTGRPECMRCAGTRGNSSVHAARQRCARSTRAQTQRWSGSRPAGLHPRQAGYRAKCTRRLGRQEARSISGSRTTRVQGEDRSSFRTLARETSSLARLGTGSSRPAARSLSIVWRGSLAAPKPWLAFSTPWRRGRGMRRA